MDTTSTIVLEWIEWCSLKRNILWRKWSKEALHYDVESNCAGVLAPLYNLPEGRVFSFMSFFSFFFF